MIRVVILDFDGVVLESCKAKATAFEMLFADEGPQIVAAVLDHHRRHGGISRLEKFEYIYKHFLRRELTPDRKTFLASRFTELCFQSVLDSPYVIGAREFIDAFHDRLDLYIASGTPQGEMREIVRRLGIDARFKGIFGSPTQKADIGAAILKNSGYSREEAIFVGDSLTDAEAAHALGVRFVGRKTSDNLDLFATLRDSLIEDLSQLPALIDSRVCAE